MLGTELWSPAGARLALKAYRRLGRRGLLEFTGGLLVSSRDWLTETFASERAHGLLAPWVLHTGLGPDAASSGFMAQVIAVATQEGGMPIPRGGGARLADALVTLIRGPRRRVRDRTRRRARARPEGRAAGVRLAGGETVTAERAVICNVTPTQLYGRLLADPAGGSPPRAAGTATAAPRCRSTSRSRSRRAGKATSASARPRSSM